MQEFDDLMNEYVNEDFGKVVDLVESRTRGQEYLADLEEIGKGDTYVGYTEQEKADIAAGIKEPKLGELIDFGLDQVMDQATVREDQATVREVASISDRQPEVIEQKKNELANIYDRQVERGEREADTTITSDINKAKATIDMPQMLGDVGGSMDRRDEAKTTPSRSLSTTKPGTSGPPESVRRGGGEGSSGGGGRKIVCTMMNDSYGFGSFRNKIWLRHSKGLAPEYQKGYHKIFLPLVKIAKTNKIVKKVLEHIAVHRTIDIRQESRGKVHLLGRVYRKILEPICYIVGKYAKR